LPSKKNWKRELVSPTYYENEARRSHRSAEHMKNAAFASSNMAYLHREFVTLRDTLKVKQERGK
jgi:hypothetical protein